MTPEQIEKVRSYKELNAQVKKGQILFTGSSLMEQFPIYEIAASAGDTRIMYNRGIGGTTTDDFLSEIDTVLLNLAPGKLFINIGTNDINERADGLAWESYLLSNLDRIYTIINKNLPDTEVYVMAYYPVNPYVNPQFAAQFLKTRTKEVLNRVNQEVKALAEKHNFHFIDVNAPITDPEGYLKAELTKEGMHMYAGAYQQIYDALKKYI